MGEMKLKPTALIHKDSSNRLKRLNIQLLPLKRVEILDQVQAKWRGNNNAPIQLSEIRTICETTLGSANYNRKPWISNETWDTIQKRNLMRVGNLQNPTDEFRNKYKAICKSIKKLVKRDRRNYFNKIAEDAQQAAEVNDSRLLYKSIKQLSNRNIRKNQPIRDENGILLTSNKNQIERWSMHFEENHTLLQIEQVSQGSTQYNRRININPPTAREVKEAIEKLKKKQSRRNRRNPR